MSQSLIIRIQNEEDVAIGNYRYTDGHRTLHSSQLLRGQTASYLFNIPN